MRSQFIIWCPSLQRQCTFARSSNLAFRAYAPAATIPPNCEVRSRWLACKPECLQQHAPANIVGVCVRRMMTGWSGETPKLHHKTFHITSPKNTFEASGCIYTHRASEPPDDPEALNRPKHPHPKSPNEPKLGRQPPRAEGGDGQQGHSCKDKEPPVAGAGGEAVSVAAQRITRFDIAHH